MLEEEGKFRVCVVVLPNGDSPPLDFLLSLAADDKKAFAKAVASLKQLADPRRHQFPNTRALKGPAKGLLELRVMGGKQRLYLRFPFFLSAEREVVILFGEKKKKAQPTQKFINQALSIKKQCDEKEASYEEYNFDEIE